MSSGPVNREALATLPYKLHPSWVRCAESYQLDACSEGADDLLCAAELRQTREQMGAIMKVADPELDRLHGIVSTLDYTVLLADPTGVIVARRGDPPFEKGCRRWNLWPGAQWSEEKMGTNGLGTCLQEQVPVTVHMNQHWKVGLRYLTCSAVPFFGPDGRIAGAIDVSSTRPDPTGRIASMMEAVLIDAARRMERRSFIDAFQNHTIIMLGESDAISLPMVALDDSRGIVGATYAARRELSLPEGNTSGVCFDLRAHSAGAMDFREAERSVIENALAMSQGKVAQAARILGVSRSTMHRKMRALL